LKSWGEDCPAQDLARRTIERRAVEAVIWGMPAVNYELMLQQMLTKTAGPNAPAGKESNWVPTKADGQFEVLFRLYGPETPLFDKTWKLPDIEKITPQ
jgi:hypothetical protein